MAHFRIAAILILMLYAIQSEVRFGKRARQTIGERSDRGSTIVLSIASAVPVFGFVLTIPGTAFADFVHPPRWFLWPGAVPEAVMFSWTWVVIGLCGIFLRLCAVLTLRARYTRTLLIQDKHVVERAGPYGFVRHPGYLGSLLTLNSIAAASCSVVVFGASVAATIAAYAHRVRVEEQMLVGAFGDAYRDYRAGVPALLPPILPRRHRDGGHRSSSEHRSKV